MSRANVFHSTNKPELFIDQDHVKIALLFTSGLSKFSLFPSICPVTALVFVVLEFFAGLWILVIFALHLQIFNMWRLFEGGT